MRLWGRKRECESSFWYQKSRLLLLTRIDNQFKVQQRKGDQQSDYNNPTFKINLLGCATTCMLWRPHKLKQFIQNTTKWLKLQIQSLFGIPYKKKKSQIPRIKLKQKCIWPLQVFRSNLKHLKKNGYFLKAEGKTKRLMLSSLLWFPSKLDQSPKTPMPLPKKYFRKIISI